MTLTEAVSIYPFIMSCHPAKVDLAETSELKGISGNMHCIPSLLDWETEDHRSCALGRWWYSDSELLFNSLLSASVTSGISL